MDTLVTAVFGALIVIMLGEAILVHRIILKTYELRLDIDTLNNYISAVSDDTANIGEDVNDQCIKLGELTEEVAKIKANLSAAGPW